MRRRITCSRALISESCTHDNLQTDYGKIYQLPGPAQSDSDLLHRARRTVCVTTGACTWALDVSEQAAQSATILPTPLPPRQGSPLSGRESLVGIAMRLGNKLLLILLVLENELWVCLPGHADGIVRFFPFDHGINGRALTDLLVDDALIARHLGVFSSTVLNLSADRSTIILPRFYFIAEDDCALQACNAFVFSLHLAIAANSPQDFPSQNPILRPDCTRGGKPVGRLIPSATCALSPLFEPCLARMIPNGFKVQDFLLASALRLPGSCAARSSCIGHVLESPLLHGSRLHDSPLLPLVVYYALPLQLMLNHVALPQHVLPKRRARLKDVAPRLSNSKPLLALSCNDS